MSSVKPPITTWRRDELLHLLALSALLFLICIYAIFLALRTQTERLALTL